MSNRIVPKWEEATNALINKLEKNGIRLENLKTLEIFGRDGTWHTKIFYDKVKTLEVWEIDKKWEDDLQKNLPEANILILDSIKTLEESEDLPKFDMILIDNPMNLFGPTDKTYQPRYCEHFDVLRNIDKIIDEKAIIIFNVNRKPFNYSKFPLWKRRREEFYKIKKTDDMPLDFLKNFYRNFFNKLGFNTIFLETETRVLSNNVDMTHYFAAYLTRK